MQAAINLPRPDVLAPAGGILLGEMLLFASVVHEEALLSLALLVHLLTFVGCALAPIRRASVGPPGLFFAFSLLPMSRLAASGLPTLSAVPLFQLVIVYAVVVPAALLIAGMESTPDPAFKWRPLQIVGPFFVPLSVLLALGQYLTLRPEAIVPTTDPGWLFLAGAFFVFVVGPVEELLFRGLLQGALERELGTPVAVLLSGTLYGAAHAQYGSLATVAVAAVAGSVFGVLYARSGSLGLVAVLNGVVGFCTFVAFPLYL